MFRHEVAFERPNKLRLECYDAKFISDGENCFATVPHVPNVVMKVPAPKALAPTDVVRDVLHAGDREAARVAGETMEKVRSALKLSPEP